MSKCYISACEVNCYQSSRRKNWKHSIMRGTSIILGVLLLGVQLACAYRGEAFTRRMFDVISATHADENVVYSPVSIETCLAITLLGAVGQTETELRNTIGFPTESKEEVAKGFHEFVAKNFKSATDGPTLTMGNRVYVAEGVKVKPEFNRLATQYFDAPVGEINFANSAAAANEINTWIEQHTNNKIKDMLTASDVKPSTSALLVSAIHFKGEWQNQFSKSLTKKADFKSKNGDVAPVEMMFQSDSFKYSDYPELNAAAVLLPYKDSDLSMLVILPPQGATVETIHDFSQKFSLKKLIPKMTFENVNVFLPKFKVDFDFQFSSSEFKKRDVPTMFSDAAQFSDMVSVPVKVEDIVHKAFIAVDEFGSEAAAATYLKMVPMSAPVNPPKVFRANRPFLFAIVNEETVFFTGHVVAL